jgi:AAA family ATP:ADP antiporter
MIGRMTSTAAAQSNPGAIEKVLGPKREEFIPVAWSFAYFFCVLSSYYIGWVASRYPRRVFLPWVYLFFISNILIFWFVFSEARDSGEDYIWLGRVFFIWLSVFNLFVVSVFWSFMADIYTREQGRRLFGLITSGGSIGALIGGVITSSLVTNIGFQNLLPLSAALLLVAVLCIRRLKDWVHGEHEDEIEKTVASEQPLGGNPLAGLTHLFSSKYFLGIALMSLVASLLGTSHSVLFQHEQRGEHAGTYRADVSCQTGRYAIRYWPLPVSVSTRIDNRVCSTCIGTYADGGCRSRRRAQGPRFRLRQAEH